MIALMASAMMILIVSAASPIRSENATKLPGNLSTIYQGEIIEITGLTPNSSVLFHNLDEGFVSVIPANETGYVKMKISAAVAPAGKYNMIYYVGSPPGTMKSAHIIIVKPKLKIRIVDKEGEEITSTTIGQPIYINTSEVQLPAEDYVEIKHKDPYGHVHIIAEVSVLELSNYEINTTNWDAGEHSIWIETVPELSYGLDMKADPCTITILYKSYIDTGQSPNPYPSIFGTHNCTIIPANDITANKIFVYPCVGTGGHAEYVRIWGNGVDAHATWNGYGGEDWNILHFNRTFTLEAGKEYNFTIKTGSYPQIFHEEVLETLDGSIVRCKEFVDANGKRHKWIPAFKIYA